VLGPRQTLQNLAICDSFVLTSVTLNTSSSALPSIRRDTVNGAEYASGIAVSLMVYIMLCVRFTFTVASNGTTLDNGGWLDLSM